MPNFNRKTELAGIAEYVQLEFRCTDTPLSSDASYVNSINAAMSDDRYIIARPARAPLSAGKTTLGIGFSVAEAVIRTTGLANNVPYDAIFAGLDRPALGCTLIDWNYVTDANDTQFSASGAPPQLATGAAPSPVQAALASDPLNPGLDLGAAASKAATTAEIVAVAVGLLALGWIVTEWKR